MNIINVTPHAIRLNSGIVYPPSGIVARVATNYIEDDGFLVAEFGAVINLPDSADDTFYIVSAIVATASDRMDLLTPATGHPDAKRDEKGQIISVPNLIKKRR